MSDFTAQAVADMQRDLEVSRRRVQDLEAQNSIITAERDQLRFDLSAARQSRDEQMTKATKMRTIIETTSLGLIAGIQTMNQDDERAKIARREQQSSNLLAESGESPRFLTRRDTLEYAARAAAGSVGGGDDVEHQPQTLEPDHRASGGARSYRMTPIERTPVALRTDAMPVPRSAHPSPVRTHVMTRAPLPAPLPGKPNPYENDPRMPRVDPMQPGPHDETPAERERRSLTELARQIGVQDEDFEVRHADDYNS